MAMNAARPATNNFRSNGRGRVTTNFRSNGHQTTSTPRLHLRLLLRGYFYDTTTATATATATATTTTTTTTPTTSTFSYFNLTGCRLVGVTHLGAMRPRHMGVRLRQPACDDVRPRRENIAGPALLALTAQFVEVVHDGQHLGIRGLQQLLLLLELHPSSQASRFMMTVSSFVMGIRWIKSHCIPA